MFVCHLSNNSAVVGVLHGTWDNFKFTKVVKFTAVIRCVITMGRGKFGIAFSAAHS